MIVRENVLLSSLTTLRVGGNARFVLECENKDDVGAAIAFAQERNLPWCALGEGSNVLAQDNGYDGVVVALRIPGIVSVDAESSVTLTAGAGVSWDALVREAAAQNLWGLENLAGIPGTVGAAPVQNIGAYGTEVNDTLTSVEVFDTETGETRALSREECTFGYRDSRFKRDKRFVILSASFTLSKAAEPNISYKDLIAAQEQGADLSTPRSIGDAVRAIRARKFPDLAKVGTAGSFFKNPTIAKDTYESLKEQYPDMPGYPNDEGVKVPLAFVLDRVLDLRGYREGNVSLFTEQPLVLVAHENATEKEIDAFAQGIATRVYNAISISIEREVQTFPSTN